MWRLLRHLLTSTTGGDIWPVFAANSGCSSNSNNNDNNNNTTTTNNNTPAEEIVNVKHQYIVIQFA
jgi:hypothetical protein